MNWVIIKISSCKRILCPRSMKCPWNRSTETVSLGTPFSYSGGHNKWEMWQAFFHLEVKLTIIFDDQRNYILVINTKKCLRKKTRLTYNYKWNQKLWKLYLKSLSHYSAFIKPPYSTNNEDQIYLCLLLMKFIYKIICHIFPSNFLRRSLQGMIVKTDDIFQTEKSLHK